MSFEKAYAFTEKWEGGHVDHKDDPGGATNWGISLRWLKDAGIDIDGDGNVDADDIKALTKEQAKALYRQKFWDQPKLDRLPTLTSIVVFDTGVNLGPGKSAKLLQEAVGAVVDGAIGPKTLALVSGMQDHSLASIILNLRIKYYHALVAARPNMKVFLAGWINRVNDLEAFIAREAKGV